MVQENTFYEDRIANILDRSISLFREVGNSSLADKWERILRNYWRAKNKKLSQK